MQLKKAKFLSFILAVVFMLCTSMITSCSSPSGSGNGSGTTSSGGTGGSGAGDSGGGGGFWPVFKKNTQPEVTQVTVPSNLGSSFTLDATDSALILYDDAGGPNGNGGIAHFFKKGVDLIPENFRTLTK